MALQARPGDQDGDGRVTEARILLNELPDSSKAGSDEAAYDDLICCLWR